MRGLTSYHLKVGLKNARSSIEILNTKQISQKRFVIHEREHITNIRKRNALHKIKEQFYSSLGKQNPALTSAFSFFSFFSLIQHPCYHG